MEQIRCTINPDGKIVAGRDRMVDILNKYAGKEVLITVEKFGVKRTKRQLDYYWAAMIRPLEKDLGWEEGKLHEYLKIKHNPVEVNDLITGEAIVIGGSTKDMTAEEMSAYIDQCRMELEEHGFHIDTPEEYYEKIGRNKSRK